MSERYVIVACRLKSIHAASVWIAVGAEGREVNVPRTLIHGAEETTLDTLLPGTSLRLRIMAWKARELGLATERDDNAARGDLFDEGEG